MKVALVLPNVYLGNRIGDHESKEPLGLLYLTSALRQSGHSVSVIQADFYGLSVEQTAEVTLMHRPDVIGLSLTQRSSVSGLKLVEVLRGRGYEGHITSGGYLPSLCTDDFLTRASGVDSAVIGEGETTFSELVGCLSSNISWQNITGMAYCCNGRTVVNPLRPLIGDLDTLPFPARDLLADAYGRMGYATIVSSRGCYGRCTFCPQNAFKQTNPGPHWRGRSPANVVDEIESIHKEFSINMFKFNDDDIFGPGELGRQRVVGICQEILRRGIRSNFMAYCRINDIDKDVMGLMREAGFERILVGVESSIPEVLKEYKKGITTTLIKEKIAVLEGLGFSIIPGFMMFNPYSSLVQLETDLEFLRETKSFGVSISKTLKVHDSTEIKRRLLEEGRLKLVPFYQGYHEYTVGNDVARVFKALKLVWGKLIDPVQAEYQHVATQLKKTGSFNSRHEYEKYLQLVWETQAFVMTRLIGFVREDRASLAEVRLLVSEVKTRMQGLIDYLCSVETQDTRTAHQYRLYPFQSAEGAHCLDLVSSAIFPTSPEVVRCIRSLISEQSTEGLDSEIREQIQTLEKKGLVNRAVPEMPKLADADSLAEDVVRVLQDKTLNSMTERYYWE